MNKFPDDHHQLQHDRRQWPQDDVAIVGLGCLIPQGRGAGGLDKALAGQAALTAWPSGERPQCLVGRCDYFNNADCGNHADNSPKTATGAPLRDRAVNLALAAAGDALADAAGVLPAETQAAATMTQQHSADLARRLRQMVDPDRVATVFSLSKGGTHAAAQAVIAFARAAQMSDLSACAAQSDAAQADAADWRHAEENSWLAYDCAAAARAIARRFALGGPCLAPAAACATGGMVIETARHLLLENRADMVVCGAADASIHPLILSSYRRLGLLAHPSHPRYHPSHHPGLPAPYGNSNYSGSADGADLRCFSGTGSGFAVGEGAAAFVLMRTAEAMRLGLPAQAIVRATYGGALAYDLLAMPTDGRTLARHIQLALERANLAADDIDMISVHGTGTADGDANEVAALLQLFGERKLAAMPLLATKHLHGHLLGAAGAVEAALVVRLLQKNEGTAAVVGKIDSGRRGGAAMGGCRKNSGLLHWQREIVRPQRVLKITAGFGGHVSILLMRRA